jgi:hypothetical protein
MSNMFIIDENPASLTRAEIDAIENPQHGEQYYDTTNNMYVVYIDLLISSGRWEQIHNHPGEA